MVVISKWALVVFNAYDCIILREIMLTCYFSWRNRVLCVCVCCFVLLKIRFLTTLHMRIPLFRTLFRSKQKRNLPFTLETVQPRLFVSLEYVIWNMEKKGLGGSYRFYRTPSSQTIKTDFEQWILIKHCQKNAKTTLTFASRKILIILIKHKNFAYNTFICVENSIIYIYCNYCHRELLNKQCLLLLMLYYWALFSLMQTILFFF